MAGEIMYDHADAPTMPPFMESSAQRQATTLPGLQYLTFSLGEEIFAMDIRSVREIIQYGAMTPVPLMPQFVRGVINLRGAVVPVIDLQVRFGREVATIGKKSCVIIFDASQNGEKVELGLLVDAVSAVVDIPDAHIEQPPQFGAAIRRDYIGGMARAGSSGFVVILALEHALNLHDMAALAAGA